MSGGVEIAPLDLDDRAAADELVAVQRASFRVEADFLGTDELPALRESAAAVRASGETFLGARLAGRLVGALGYKRRGGVVDIHRLVVHPDVFRRGIGTALLDALAALEPARRTVVAAGVANVPARRLYERCGFRAVRQRIAAAGVAIVELERP